MSDSLEGLNEAQKKAVSHASGPLLVVAGAGTGKTTVLARRYGWLMENLNIGTSNILSLTFTEKAAEEMEDRVLVLLPNGTYDFWISTFHGFCQRVLERHALDIGLPNRFRILNETDAWLLVKRHIHDFPLDHYRPLGNPLKFLSSLLSHFSRAKDEGVTPEAYLSFVSEANLDADVDPTSSLQVQTKYVADNDAVGDRKRLEELSNCFHLYRSLLRDEGCLDFGDLLVETLRLFRERPAILREYQEQFSAIMVDEFQDTNSAQYELLKLLAGRERNLTIVGDDDQAIYKFRGASLANILQFREDFPDAVTIALRDNYRSTQEILDASAGFIRKNDPNRLETQLKNLGLDKTLRAARPEGGKVRSIWYESLDDEAEAVASAIKRKRDDDSELSWNDFAILVRSNDSAIPFIQALERQHIPYSFLALRGLYAKSAIVDLIALMTLCVDTHDATIVWRALTAPCYGMLNSDINEFFQTAKRKSVMVWQTLSQAAILNKTCTQKGIEMAQNLVNAFNGMAEDAKRETPLVMLQIVLERTGFLKQILSRPEAEKVEALNHLQAFAKRIKRYEASNRVPSLKDFLEELNMEIESGDEGALDFDPDAGPEQVKVMTVHASKGLEFKHVFVVSLVDQRFPTRERGEQIPLPDGLVTQRMPQGDTHLEEERRLMYVAMTRAKDSLTLTGAANYGSTRKKKPSVFMQEIEIEIEEEKSQNDKNISNLLFQPHEDGFDNDEEPATQLVLKRRFSFTQLAAFRKCPLQYKFAHIYRIPILGSFHRSFGQAMHLTLHDVLERNMERSSAKQVSLFDVKDSETPAPESGFRVSIDEALAIYEERWHENDQWYPNRKMYEEYKSVGKSAIKKMHEQWSAQPPNIKALELSFDWKIGEHSIKGSVDRIDLRPDGTVHIYDYKTGEPRTSEELETSDKEQLHLYQLAMEDRGMPVGALYYVYARTGQEASVNLLQGEAKTKFLDSLKERMRDVLLSRYPAKPNAHLCRYCDFKNICEYRKL
jgi:DNA helicase-2/ATP-dependent DNA helicase PcrA